MGSGSVWMSSELWSETVAWSGCRPVSSATRRTPPAPRSPAPSRSRSVPPPPRPSYPSLAACQTERASPRSSCPASNATPATQTTTATHTRGESRGKHTAAMWLTKSSILSFLSVLFKTHYLVDGYSCLSVSATCFDLMGISN